MTNLLGPFERLTARLTATRVARQGWQSPVPVICCGNVTVGGAGKTTVALDLGRRLVNRGVAVHFLTRGYGGSSKGVARVTERSDVTIVGDEPLLLSAIAPTWIGADRAAAARAAIAEGAKALVMDDGLQNPSLRKTISLLVVDGRTGFGNGRLLPAGPLREPVNVAARRCAAVVMIGVDRQQSAAALPPSLPILTARLRPGPAALALAGRRTLAFAGIANPDKFFLSLEEAGAEVAWRVGFADHHFYKTREVDALLLRARRDGLIPVTTAKDAVRLPPPLRTRVHVADVILLWDDPKEIESILTELLRSAAGS